MPYLLNLAYLLLIVLLSPWLLWAALRTGKYRQGLPAKLFGQVPIRQSSGKCIWLHAVSVGEVNLLSTLLDRLEQRHPEWQYVISTTTKTGYDLACKKYASRSVFYCPLDFTWAVNRALQRIRPDALVLAELELWPNLIRCAGQHGVKVAIVNARLSDNSFRGYRRIGWLIRSLLRQINLVAVQNDEYANRFEALGAPHSAVQITGSLKFDGAQTDRNNPKTRQLANLAGITENDVVFLAGSTQQGEEKLALQTFLALCPQHPQLRLILVPRHPERFNEVAGILQRSNIAWQRRSLLKPPSGAAGSSHSNQSGTPRVLLVDAVGELGAWWGTSHIAYVGGSMGNRGGQNMIEPAAYGAALSFGPNTRNFRDIVSTMLADDAAVVLQNGEEMTDFVEKCLTDRSFASALGEKAKQLVCKQLGAADRTVDLIDTMLAPQVSPVQRAA